MWWNNKKTEQQKRDDLRAEVLKYIFAQNKFSPTNVSGEFGIELSLAFEICNEAEKLSDNVNKWYVLLCLQCDKEIKKCSTAIPKDTKATCKNCRESVTSGTNNCFIYYTVD